MALLIFFLHRNHLHHHRPVRQREATYPERANRQKQPGTPQPPARPETGRGRRRTEGELPGGVPEIEVGGVDWEEGWVTKDASTCRVVVFSLQKYYLQTYSKSSKDTSTGCVLNRIHFTLSLNWTSKHQPRLGLFLDYPLLFICVRAQLYIDKSKNFFKV